MNVAIAVVTWANHFVIGRRPPGVPLAGYAEFPGGKVKSGESAEQAAKRECLEETGLAVEVVANALVVDHEYDHGQLRLDFFACHPAVRQGVGSNASVEVLSQRFPLSEPFRWLPASALPDLEFPPANDKLVAEIQAAGLNWPRSIRGL